MIVTVNIATFCERYVDFFMKLFQSSSGAGTITDIRCSSNGIIDPDNLNSGPKFLVISSS